MFDSGLSGERLSYLAPLFACGFSAALGLLNYFSGEEFVVYLVLAFSMLAVAYSQYVEK